MNWYYADQGQQKGPIAAAELDELVRAGQLAESALVWQPGMADWKPYSTIKVPHTTLPDGGTCVSCGRPVTTQDSVVLGSSITCAECKPVLVERLREGEIANLPGTMPYSGFWIRFTARAADYTLLTLVQAIFTGTSLVWINRNHKQGDGLEMFSAFGVSALLGLAVSCLYESAMLATRGATVGKMLCYLRVVHPDGSPLGVGASIGRYFAELISRFAIGIGYLMAAFDVEHRAMHDRIAGTRVIDVPPQPDVPEPAFLPVNRELRCEKCHTPIPSTDWNALDPLPCPNCNTSVQAIVFRAFADALERCSPQPKDGEGEAGCFYHDTSRATITCEECGRFLCALCDLDAGPRHLCPACFNNHTGDPVFVQRRTLYDSIALTAALVPNLLIYFTIFTAPIVVGFAIWSWKKPGSITPRGRWRFVVALMVAATNILFVVAGILALAVGAFK